MLKKLFSTLIVVTIIVTVLSILLSNTELSDIEKSEIIGNYHIETTIHAGQGFFVLVDGVGNPVVFIKK